MSYVSENELPPGTSLSRLKEVVELLGYKKIRDNLKYPGKIGSSFWYDESDYKS